MSSINLHKLRKHSQGYLVWAVALSVWLFTVGISTIHAQKHVMLDDNQCQLCLSSFNHTPFIASETISVTPLEQTVFLIEYSSFSSVINKISVTGNRDPPLINS